MKLPNCSNMMRMGEIRHIQSIGESGPLRNPDNLVGHLLSPSQRLACRVRARFSLWRLRSNPFYPYVLARTRYYDDWFLQALASGVKTIVNIGCGSDTRSYRFLDRLRELGVHVAECDQPVAIESKRNVAARLWPTEHIAYLPVDLNRCDWDELDQWLAARHDPDPVFVLMEGVSPYIARDAFGLFLRFLAVRLPPDSRFAYDFKIQGAADSFGRSPHAEEPFRLSMDEEAVSRFHEAHGFQVDWLERSEDLTRRLLPAPLLKQLFAEDGLLQLTARPGREPAR